MSSYAPYAVTHDCAAYGLVAFDRPSPLGSIRLYAQAPSERGVVFLHGVGQSWVCWTPVLQAARAQGLDTSRWVFVDLPGFGHSADLPGPVTLDVVGEAVLAALAEQGLREISLVGHSMGGFLALDMMARTTPETPVITSGVTLSGAYAGIVEFVNAPLTLARRRPALATASTGLWLGSLLGAGPARLLARFRPARAAFALLLGLVAAFPRRLPDSFLRSLLLEVRPKAFRIAARTGVGYDCSGTWSRIRQPLTAVFGASDRLVDDGDRNLLVSACPSAQVIVLPETGHFTPIERPDDVAALVARAKEA